MSLRSHLVRTYVALYALAQFFVLIGVISWAYLTARADLDAQLRAQALRLGHQLVQLRNAPNALQQSLASLGVQPDVLAVAMYAMDGRLLATYRRKGAAHPSSATRIVVPIRADAINLHVALPDRSGQLVVWASTGSAAVHAVQLALVCVLTMSLGFALAWWLLRKQRARLYQAEDSIRRAAESDKLTGLANRTAFLHTLDTALRMASSQRMPLSVLFMDLDNFKIINDTLGHGAGDALLREVGRRLRALSDEHTHFGRLGGDEFGIIVRGAGKDDSVRLAERILQHLSAPIDLVKQQVYVGASIGIALYPQDGHDASTLLKRADAAMYQAKENGRNNYQFFSTDLHFRALQHFVIEMSLRRALENGELALYYQPQVEISTRRIVGVEALLRWKSPEFGTFASSDFIAIAEQSGLIHQLGAWSLETACRQARAWESSGLGALSVAVNLSVRQLHSSDIVRLVRETLAKTGLDPRLLELEITETIFVKHNNEVMDKLKALADLGVRLAIDDFGTGYSSLSYLRRLPVHRLKIDKSFVRDSHFTPDDAAIAAAIIAMARKLDIEVTAEGVENEEQLALLRDAGCHLVQGYYFGSPLPAEELECLVRQLRRSEPSAGPALTSGDTTP
ncbi:MAG: EAL domain-containing protein [Thiobacillaceae bacterium]|nr:EAL domain-containing protein [Thiobacillaceae bacterium]